MRDVIPFKSTPDNYWKEHSGRKSNTLRKVDENDERFIKLKRMGVTEDYGIIQMINKEIDDGSVFFLRRITDRTFFNGYVIVSWSSEEKDGETKL